MTTTVGALSANVMKAAGDAAMQAASGVFDVEAKARGEADAAEAKTRAAAVKDLADRQVILSGAISIPVTVNALAGKMTRVSLVPGVKAGENLNLTLKAALPAGLTLGEVYCLKDGEVTIVLLSITTISISPAVTIPFTIAVLRNAVAP